MGPISDPRWQGKNVELDIYMRVEKKQTLDKRDMSLLF